MTADEQKLIERVRAALGTLRPDFPIVSRHREEGALIRPGLVVADLRALCTLAERALAVSSTREDGLREAAEIADGFRCGGCGMDGKAGEAIRSRIHHLPDSREATPTPEGWRLVPVDLDENMLEAMRRERRKYMGDDPRINVPYRAMWREAITAAPQPAPLMEKK